MGISILVCMSFSCPDVTDNRRKCIFYDKGFTSEVKIIDKQELNFLWNNENLYTIAKCYGLVGEIR